MTTIWGPVTYPTSVDGFAPALLDNVDEVIDNHPNTLAQAIIALENKLGVDGGIVSSVGGVEFQALVSSPGDVSVWVDNSGGPGNYNLYYTDDGGVDYLIGGPGVVPPGGSSILMFGTGISLTDGTNFTIEEVLPNVTEGVGYFLEFSPTAGTGLVTIEGYQDVARSELVFIHYIDLSDTSTYDFSDAYGFELETTGILYCTILSSGVPGGTTADIIISAISLQPVGVVPPLPSPYGDGIEDDGFGRPRVALASDSGLEFSAGKLVIQEDLTADVQVSRTASGLSVIGAMTTTTDETVAVKKRFDATGLTPLAAEGPPIAGDYFVGDEILDLTYIKYRCISSGTPGNWELADNVATNPVDLISSTLSHGATEILEIPTLGNYGFIQQLYIWGRHATVAHNNYEIPFRVRIYETSGGLGREMVWQSNGLVRQTYLTAILPPAQAYLEVDSNNVIEVDESVVVYQDDTRYEMGRCSARLTGYINISEALVDANSWAIDCRVLVATEYTMVPFINKDGVTPNVIFIEIRHDGIVTDPDLVFYVRAKVLNIGLVGYFLS